MAEKYKVVYQGVEVEIERLPNGKFKKPNLNQFTKQGLACTWLDDCRIPVAQGEQGYVINTWDGGSKPFGNGAGHPYTGRTETQGRLPANLLCSDNVLDDGRVQLSGKAIRRRSGGKTFASETDKPSMADMGYSDSGSFSRYFSLDQWAAKNLPSFDDTLGVYSNAHTFAEHVAVLDARIQHTGGCHDSVAYLYELSHVQRPFVSPDTVLLHSTLSKVLERDFPVLLRNLDSLLSGLACGADLHSRLVANEVLCAQSLRALADFLDDYQEGCRLRDALSSLAQGLSPALLWLLACALEHSLWSQQAHCQDDRCGCSDHQIPFVLLLTCYGLVHSLPQIADKCKSEMWQAKLSQLPESVQRTFPFLLVAKAGKKEKEIGLKDMPEVTASGLPLRDGSGDYVENVGGDGSMSTRQTRRRNTHPTVKPLKLMSYLITLGSRPGDLVLDPFAGTCRTGMAAKMLGRDWLMIEIDEQWCKIGQRAIEATQARLL